VPIGALALGVAGNDLTLQHNRLADVPLGELDLGVAGNDPSVIVGLTVTPDTGELDLGVVGNDLTLQHNRLADVDTIDTLVLGGIAPVGSVAHIALPTTVGLVLDTDTLEPIGSVGNVAIPAIDELVLASDAITIQHNRIADVPVGALVLSGKLPVIPAEGVVEVPTGSLNIWKYIGLKLDGFPPTATVSGAAKTADPTTGALVLDGSNVPTLNVTALPAVGSLALGVAGLDPSAIVANLREPSTIGLALASDAGESVVGHVSVPSVVGLALSGKQPTLGPSDNPEIPAKVALALAGIAPVTVVGHVTTPSTIGLVLSGQTLIDATDIEVGIGSLVISGQSVNLKGVVEPQTGSINIYKYTGLKLDGIPPSLLHNRVSLPTTGSCVFASDPLERFVSGGSNETVLPATATLVLASAVISAPIAIPVSPAKVGLSLSGKLPVTSITVYPGSGELVILSAAHIHTPASLGLTGQLVTAFIPGGTPIVNVDAVTDQINNYLQCDMTGFRVDVESGLKMQWNKYAVRKRSYSERHPQEHIKSRNSDFSRKGPKRPEQDDVYIEDLYEDGVDGSDL